MTTTFTFSFLDGHIETSTFDRSELAHELVHQLFRIVRVWQADYDLVIPQINLYNRLNKRIQLNKDIASIARIASELIGDDNNEYNFFVFFVPLEQVDRLTVQEVEELYRSTGVETEVNEDSFRRFASVLWVDHVDDQQIVFYRVKDRHVYANNIVNSVGYRWSDHPCWEFGTIPMTDLAKRRWNYIAVKKID